MLTSRVHYMGRRNIADVSIANRLSVDCDCDPNPHEPEMADIGIFASLDPVALDQACGGLRFTPPRIPARRRLSSACVPRHGVHTIETAETGAWLA